MDYLPDLLREAGQAAIGLLALPYFYIAILFAWWHVRQGVALQRKLFHVRLYSALYTTLIRVGAGVAIGLLLSVIGFGFGTGAGGLTTETLLFVYVAMAALALLKLRYICLAYAAGAIGVLQSVLDWFSVDGSGTALEDALSTLSAIDVPALLFLAGMLHIAEGVLIRYEGAKSAIPLFLQGKRGKPLGAYSLSGVWPVPLLWLIPAAGDGGSFTLPWSPLFGENVSAWSLLAFPVLIGFSDRTTTYWPEQKARVSGYGLMLYGITIAGLSVGAVFWESLVFVAALAAFVLHEGLLAFSRSRETGRQALYTQDGTGVKVLAVLPGTPAAEMGLQAGEIIRKVNGMSVRNKEQLHAALQRQSAFCKLEVANRTGELKFMQRARYEGEHYQLGLILAPDEDVEFVVAPRSASFWQGLRDAGARRLATSPTMQARREAERAEAEQAAAEEAARIDALAAAEAERKKLIAEVGLPPRGSGVHVRKE